MWCSVRWVVLFVCIYIERERGASHRSFTAATGQEGIDAMETVAVRRINRKSSIESEPRTLGVDQIQFARELALYVMNTRSMDEALAIFTTGLKPAVSTGVANADTAMEDPNEEYLGHGQSNKLQRPEPRMSYLLPSRVSRL